MIDSISKLEVEGYFTLVKRSATTGQELQRVGPFKNMITQIGLNRIGTAAPSLSYVYLGTGTNPAAPSDTTMGAFAVQTNRVEGSDVNLAPVNPTWFTQTTTTKRFNPGEAVGNFTEVGIGWNANPVNNLWSRELIVDSSGNPTTITVLPNEYLDVVYSVRYYLNTSDFSGAFTLNGVGYTYTGRIGQAGSSSFAKSYIMGGPRVITAFTGEVVALGPITGTPTGTTIGGTAPTGAQLPYVNNSLELRLTSSWTTTGGNGAQGIKAMQLNIGMGPSTINQTYQILLDRPIPKTVNNTMSFTWAISWGRRTP